MHRHYIQILRLGCVISPNDAGSRNIALFFYVQSAHKRMLDPHNPLWLFERARSKSLVYFQADPTSPARYFCSHAGGVHAVGLPMVTKLAEMASGGEAADATLSCLQGGN